jgi:hypothetical protein
MAQLIGEVKINKFLEQHIMRFQLPQYEKKDFIYSFQQNDAACAIGYERRNHLFSRNYNFTITIEKQLINEQLPKEEVSYSFVKKKWLSKQESSLLQFAKKHFNMQWEAIDFLSIKILQEGDKRIFKMSMLPGSYTALIFPPMKQGIDMHEEEIRMLREIIESVSSKLHYSA